MTKSLAVVVAVVLAAGAAATAWWLRTPKAGTNAQAAVVVGTAAVQRANLSTTTQLSGTLGYAGSYSIVAQLSGTITALPAPGRVISRGARVYELDGSAVYLFYGARPAWRPFVAGMTPGPDVRELEQNLARLGYGADLVIDRDFTWATEVAIEAWQRATGQSVTGSVDLGRIMFLPGPVRIETDSAPLGAPAQAGQPVLAASSPRPVVTVQVPTTQAYLVRRGDQVTITLPSGVTTQGHVVAISTVASDATQSPDQSNNGPQQVSIPALVTLARPGAAAHLDQAPVTVNVVDQTVRNVLAVPITALVALAGGGYAVWVDANHGRNLVRVTPGLFANTLVQVSGNDLHVGDRVEVPSQ
ncbi:MAG TPA: peptidoglycan-binding protein [Jatrophihabitans sp.]|nr:peptidoglycan-binding protein [Jatrophihabitans sp.]